MARATCLITKATNTALDGGVHFPDEFSITADAFALGQVLNFGILAYVADCYGELCPLYGVLPVDSKPRRHPLC